MAKVLSGKEVSEALQETVKARVSVLQEKGVPPKLVTIRVGENGSDIAYESSATKKLGTMNVLVENAVLPMTATQEDLFDMVKEQGAREEVHGILVFQPLPSGWDEEILRTTLNPAKDVDCTTLENLGKLLAGKPRFCPGAPAGVMALLAHYNMDLTGKTVALIGRSTVVGRPLAQLLTSAGATVTICHSKTVNLSQVCQKADILVTSAGVPKLVGKDFVHKDQIVVDVSTNVVDGKLCGDISVDEIADIVEAYTPTPGGIGAITTTILASQVVDACESLIK